MMFKRRKDSRKRAQFAFVIFSLSVLRRLRSQELSFTAPVRVIAELGDTVTRKAPTSRTGVRILFTLIFEVTVFHHPLLNSDHCTRIIIEKIQERRSEGAVITLKLSTRIVVTKHLSELAEIGGSAKGKILNFFFACHG
jgi:hypothetical protein